MHRVIFQNELPAVCGGGQKTLTARGQKISGEIKTPETSPFLPFCRILFLENKSYFVFINS
jgi:hypothetical protein